MRSCGNHPMLGSGVILRLLLVFLGCFTALPCAFAKTEIKVNADTCEISVIMHKEFYLITTASRNREIQALDDEINGLDQWLQGAKADLDTGVTFDGMDMDASRKNYDRASSDRQDLVDRRKELQDANAEESIWKPGMTPRSKDMMIEKWDRIVEQTWNGTAPYAYDCCKVKFIYDYQWRQEDASATSGFDQVGLHISQNFRGFVSGFDSGFDADGFSNDPFEHDMSAELALYDKDEKTYAHEAGHEMGLCDRYVEKKEPDGSVVSVSQEGYENDLMGSLEGAPVSTGNNGLNVDNIKTILSKLGILCPVMPCCPPPRDVMPRPEPDEPREVPPDVIPMPEPGDEEARKVPPDVTPESKPEDEEARRVPPDTIPGPAEPGPKSKDDVVPKGPTDTLPQPTGPIIVIGCREGGVYVRIISGDGTAGQPTGSGGSVSGDFVAVLKKGTTDADAARIAEGIKGKLKSSGACKKADDVLKDEPEVDFIEKIYWRDVQADSGPTEPNDPFYWDPSSHKEKRSTAKATDILPPEDKGPSGACVFIDAGKGVICEQWGLQAVGFLPYRDPRSAWNLVDEEKKNTVVAVIDSGLDLTHPDGPEFLWTNAKEVPDNGKDDDNNGYVDDVCGWNFLDENNDLTDRKGHGTFVAGIIAARTNNGLAIAGVDPGAQVMALKVVNENGKADSLNIYRALRYAADHGARVINISLAGLGVSKLEKAGIEYAHAKGCVIVIAAGNHSRDVSDYGPAALRRAIVVSAFDPQGRKMWFSNIGANVGLTAPGKAIFSLYSRDSEWTGPAYKKDDLCYAQDGTSFSAPFVSGVAALLWARDPALTNIDIEDILYQSSRDVESEGWDQYAGAGLLDAFAALSTPKARILTARFTAAEIKTDEKGKVAGLDLYGVVRGDVAGYTVELAKGKKPSRWEKAFESLGPAPDNGLLCTIDGKKIKFGKEWSLRLIATDTSGKIKKAILWIEL